MTFRIGQKVVCIKEPIPQADCPYRIFQKDAIYTVAGFDEDVDGTYISVAELHPRVTGHIEGFRPVVDRRTDISVFTEILRTTKAPVKAYALPSQDGKTL